MKTKKNKTVSLETIILNKEIENRKLTPLMFSMISVLKRGELDLDLSNYSVDGTKDMGIDFILPFNGNTLLNWDDISNFKEDHITFYVIQHKGTEDNVRFSEGRTFNKEYTLKFFEGIKIILDLVETGNDDLKDKISKINSLKSSVEKTFHFYYIGDGIFHNFFDLISEAKIEIEESLLFKKQHNMISSNSSLDFFDNKRIYDLKEQIDIKQKVISLEIDSLISENYIIDNKNEEKRAFIFLAKMKEIKKLINEMEIDNIFEQNIRASLGGTKVNKNILFNINDEKTNDFWIYNNGITIVNSGKMTYKSKQKELELINPMIIDGQQTANSIFESKENEKKVLVKAISNLEKDTKQDIIIANNKNNPITPLNIMANDKKQILFEEFLLVNDIKYERRKEQFSNEKNMDFISPSDWINIFYSIIKKQAYKCYESKTSYYLVNGIKYNEVWDLEEISKRSQSLNTIIKIFFKFKKEFKEYNEKVKKFRDLDFTGDNKIVFMKFYILQILIHNIKKESNSQNGFHIRDVEEINQENIELSVNTINDIILKMKNEKTFENLKNFRRTNSLFQKFMKELESE